MPEPEVSERVNRRLEELHRRYAAADGETPVKYYDSVFGYYGPEAAGDERHRFGLCLMTPDGEPFSAGDHDCAFPLQSISKVLSYALAVSDHGPEALLRHVGVEPSGDAFNSILFDERNRRPHNPMVNAGALVTSDMVRGADPSEKLERLLDVVRRFTGNARIEVDEEIFQAELAGADRNRATAYLMRSEGMLTGDVEALLALYLRQCSIKVTACDLAVAGATLANGCVNPLTGDRVIPTERVRDVLSVMHTCGMYDAAGQWAYEVGVPAKSGVSGGILAAVPGKLGLGVYSPGLDAYGNSVRGVGVCREMSERLGLHVFATQGEDAMLGPSH